MPIRKYKPTGPGRRFRSVSTFSELTRNKALGIMRRGNQPVEPHKPLLAPIHKTGGRNNKGRITHRFHGGGHKRMYRIIDFKRDKYEVPGTVLTIEYDPNRSCRISLVEYGEGDVVIASDTADIKPGNSMPLRAIPVGTTIHNIELHLGKGGQLVRSAGV